MCVEQAAEIIDALSGIHGSLTCLVVQVMILAGMLLLILLISIVRFKH